MLRTMRHLVEIITTSQNLWEISALIIIMNYRNEHNFGKKCLNYSLRENRHTCKFPLKQAAQIPAPLGQQLGKPSFGRADRLNELPCCVSGHVVT